MLKHLAFKALKEEKDRLLALNLLIPYGLDDTIKVILSQKCIKKKVRIEASDRFGIDISLKLNKPNGKIWITIHKKRKFYISITIHNFNKCLLWSSVYEEGTSKGLNDILDKFSLENHILYTVYSLLICEFHYHIRNYIMYSMSRKWSVMNKFIQKLFNLKKKDFEFKGYMTTTDNENIMKF